MIRRKDKLSNDELELVITELSEQLNDVEYFTGLGYITTICRSFGDKWLNRHPDMQCRTMSYGLKFTAGDIQRVVDRARRVKLHT